MISLRPIRNGIAGAYMCRRRSGNCAENRLWLFVCEKVIRTIQLFYKDAVLIQMRLIQDLQDFIKSQPTTITEFNEVPVKRLITKITVF